MTKVKCPCCHGKKFLLIIDESGEKAYEYSIACSHCEGTGEIDAEVEE